MTILAETAYPNIWFSNEIDIEELVFHDRDRCSHCGSVKESRICDNENCDTFLLPTTIMDRESITVRDIYGNEMSMGNIRSVGHGFGANSISDRSSYRRLNDLQDLYNRGGYGWSISSSIFASR